MPTPAESDREVVARLRADGASPAIDALGAELRDRDRSSRITAEMWLRDWATAKEVAAVKRHLRAVNQARSRDWFSRFPDHHLMDTDLVALFYDIGKPAVKKAVARGSLPPSSRILGGVPVWELGILRAWRRPGRWPAKTAAPDTTIKEHP